MTILDWSGLHEFAHAKSGKADMSSDFELTLTDVIGILATSLVNKQELSRPYKRQERDRENDSWR